MCVCVSYRHKTGAASKNKPTFRICGPLAVYNFFQFGVQVIFFKVDLLIYS